MLCLILTACGTPVQVERRDARTVAIELTSNALTTGKPSLSTQILLHLYDLDGLYAEAPAKAIMVLHQIVAAGDAGPDALFALAELSFLQGERTGEHSQSLAAVVYAYAFLFPAQPADRPNPFDPRLRAAADIYNRALTQGLAEADGEHVDLRSGDYPLPFGSLSIDFDPDALRWGDRVPVRYIPAAELHIEGLQNRYRIPGIGAPLAADLSVDRDQRGFQTPAAVKLPVTALLRLDASVSAIAGGRISGRLTLYPDSGRQMVAIGGQQVPLESEPSAALAYALSNPDVWRTEVTGFLRGDLLQKLPTQLFGLEPYHPGRIPVVLIHGTASSAGRWADLINDLQNDPAIREHFQFWLYTYDTGNPIILSALQLRTQLEAALKQLDPNRRDPALRNVVLIGHSQGGLLAKMLVINSGSRLFDAFSTKPLDEIPLPDTTRDTIRRAFFLTPIPDVTRVIFIATPQRGSFFAGGTLPQLIGRLVTLPLDSMRMLADVLSSKSNALRLDPSKVHFGSIYGMTPGSPMISALASIPVAPNVVAHSIIAVKGDGPVETGDDGVVEYSSAHIDEAASELVVRSGHSVQGDPRTVAEVRRILMLQWQTACPTGCLMDATPAGTAVPRPIAALP